MSDKNTAKKRPSRKRAANRDTAADSPLKSFSLDQLSDVVMKPRAYSFTVHGKTFEIGIHPLNDLLWEQAEAFNDISPPRLPGAKDAFSLDYNDPDYRAKMRAADKLRVAYLIAKACPQLGLTDLGESQASDLLRQKLPALIIERLVEKIEAVSKNEISGMADFFIESESAATRS